MFCGGFPNRASRSESTSWRAASGSTRARCRALSQRSRANTWLPGSGTGRVSLGLGLVAIVAPALVGLGIEQAVRPLLAELARETGETSSFSVLGRAAGRERRTGPRRWRREDVFRTGKARSWAQQRGRQDAARACGKGSHRCLLREAPRASHARTITDLAKLRAELALIRARGYAINTGESEIDVGCRILRGPRPEWANRRHPDRHGSDLSFRRRAADETSRPRAAGREEAWTVAAFRLAIGR